MHLLVVLSDHFATRGSPLAGIFQWHQAQALKRAGYKVSILSPGFQAARDIFTSYPYQKQEVKNDIPVFRNYPRRLIPLRLFSAAILSRIYIRLTDKMFREYISVYGMPDCIHAHNIQFAGISAAALKKKYGVPFILTEHSSTFARGQVDKVFFPLMEKGISEAAVRTTVSSTFSKLLNTEIFPGLNAGFGVLNNILDTSFSGELPAVSRNNNEFVFLNVARVDENKDHATMIRAFADAFAGQPVHLRIGGDGPALKTLYPLVRELGIEKQVSLLGLLDRDSVKEEMVNADAFVLSSKYETFGVVLIEAMACGLPVISTRCSGPEDIVTEETGELVPIENVGALSGAMKNMVVNINRYQKNAIRAQTLERFGEETFVNKASEMYRQAINKNN